MKFKQEFPHEVMQGGKKTIKSDYDIKGLCVCYMLKISVSDFI